MTGDLVGTRCAICDRLAPITVADVIGRERSDHAPTSYAGWSIEGFLAREAMPTSPPSGENMLIMIPPGAAWMNVPDAIDTEPAPAHATSSTTRPTGRSSTPSASCARRTRVKSRRMRGSTGSTRPRA